MPRLKQNEYSKEESDTKDAYDIISEGIQKYCEIPGCRPKFHLEEARHIVERLKNAKLLKES